MHPALLAYRVFMDDSSVILFGIQWNLFITIVLGPKSVADIEKWLLYMWIHKYIEMQVYGC